MQRVLGSVAEDNPATGAAVREALETAGYKVLLAENGQEALSLFERHTQETSLVISDLVMPEMGGEQLHTSLLERSPDLKMVLLTGYPLDQRDKERLEPGGVIWLQKPVSLKKLTAAVREVLDA